MRRRRWARASRGGAAGTFGVAGGDQFLSRPRRWGAWATAGPSSPTTTKSTSALRQLHDHGRGADGEIVSWGFNSRLDNLQAAILDFRLAVVRRRYRAAARAGRSLPARPAGDRAGAAAAGARTTIRITSTCIRTTRSRRTGATPARFSDDAPNRTALPWGGKAVHQWDGPAIRSAAALHRKAVRTCAAAALEPFPHRSTMSTHLRTPSKISTTTSSDS